MKITQLQKDAWPEKLLRQVKSISEHVADYKTVEQALDLLYGQEELSSRVCRLYLLHTKQNGQICERNFFNAHGEIISGDETTVTL